MTLKRNENTTEELETAALALICADALEAAGNPGQAAEEFRQIALAVKAASDEEPGDPSEDPIELRLDFIRMTDLRYAVRLIGLCVDVSPLLLHGVQTLPAAAMAEYGTAAELLAAAARSAAYRVYRGTRTMENRAEARHYNSKALDGSRKAGKLLSAVCDSRKFYYTIIGKLLQE